MGVVPFGHERDMFQRPCVAARAEASGGGCFPMILGARTCHFIPAKVLCAAPPVAFGQPFGLIACRRHDHRELRTYRPCSGMLLKYAVGNIPSDETIEFVVGSGAQLSGADKPPSFTRSTTLGRILSGMMPLAFSRWLRLATASFGRASRWANSRPRWCSSRTGRTAFALGRRSSRASAITGRRRSDNRPCRHTGPSSQRTAIRSNQWRR